MRIVRATLTLLFAFLVLASAPPQTIDERVKDLLGRMTLEEKIAQMGSTWQDLSNGQDPLTYTVSLLTGILNGEPWSAHLTDVAVVAAIFAICVALSARIFRWE